MGDYGDAFMRNKDAAVQARTKAQNRATVLQLKLIGQSHPTGLTSNLLKLFEPRPPLEYKPPPEKRKMPSYTGMAQFVQNFAEPGDTEYAPPVPHVETPTQRRARIHRLRLEKGAEQAAKELEKYDPTKDPNVSGDPYKTLFVARLSYETTEHKIKREFEVYGPIKRVRLVNDNVTNKPRGYAFVEYMHTRDMKTAYKQADGRKIDNKRVLVDVERGRTVPNWRPRRLGGGLGSTRVGGEEVNQKYSGREPQLLSAGPPRIEEPKIREERHDDRERDNDRDRDRDRKERERELERSHERSQERSHERSRGRDRDRDYDHDRDRDVTREHDRYHRDRDRDRGERDRDRGERDKDRGERDKDRGERDRDRGERDKDRGERDKDRGERDKDRGERDRDRGERDKDRGERDKDRGERDKDRDRGRDRDRHRDRERDRPRERERERDRIERSHSHDYERER